MILEQIKSLVNNRTLEYLNQIAYLHQGECLDQNYINAHFKYTWKCKNNHIFQSLIGEVKNGYWCQICKKQDLLKRIQDYCALKHGVCESSSYVNSKQKMKFKCKYGHIWHTNACILYNNSWCPYCVKNFNLSEEKTRFIFEQLTNKKFKKDRKILNGLELDGYNEDLKLAFEYNGIYHYKNIAKFRRAKNVQKVDKKKKLLCKKLGIKLIVVKYSNNISDNHLLTYISNKLKIYKEINWNIFYRCLSNSLDLLKTIVANKGGKILTSHYYGHKTKIEVECKFKHKWQVLPQAIKRGAWCKKCSHENLKRKHIEERGMPKVTSLTNKYNGRILGKYINNKSPVFWVCKNKHTWRATLNAMNNRDKRNIFCLKCKT